MKPRTVGTTSLLAVLYAALTGAPSVSAVTLAAHRLQVATSKLRASRDNRGGSNRTSASLSSQVPQLASLPLEKKARPLAMAQFVGEGQALGDGATALAKLFQRSPPRVMQPEVVPSSSFGNANQPLPAASFIFSELHLRESRNHTADIPGPAVSLPTSPAQRNPAPQQLQLKRSKVVVAAQQKQGQGVSQQEQQDLSPKSWWALTFSFAFVVKAMCILSNFAFQVSPIPQIGQFRKLGDTGEVDPAPFICIMYGGYQWCFYGTFAFIVTKNTGFLVLVYSNLMGAVLGSFYLWSFQINCKRKETMRTLFLYCTATSTLAFLQLAAMVVLPRESALLFSGLVSSVFSVVTATSLLTNLPTVFRTRCSASMNVPMLAIGLFSSCLWLMCGLCLSDAWIIIPNLVAILIQGFALAVSLIFPRDGYAKHGAMSSLKHSASSPLVAVMAAISVSAAAQRVSTAMETLTDAGTNDTGGDAGGTGGTGGTGEY